MELPPEGQRHLALDVSGAKIDEKVRQIVQNIKTTIAGPMRTHGGKTPTKVTPSPRESLDSSIESFEALAIQPVDRSPQKQLRRRCLERDGYKCVATGQYSRGHPHPPNALTTLLEAAHIIPFALGAFDEDVPAQVTHNSHIWTNLRRYFPVLRDIHFTGEQINEERNVLMLDKMLHQEFGAFRLIFEETGVPHQYKITTFKGCLTGSSALLLPEDRIVKFTIHGGHWDLPDPALLKIHASIGRFLNMTGMAEAIDKILEDLGGCGGLAPDGSTNVEELLAVSRLGLLSLNVNEMPGPQLSPEKHRPGENQRRPQGKSLDTENTRSWGY